MAGVNEEYAVKSPTEKTARLQGQRTEVNAVRGTHARRCHAHHRDFSARGPLGLGLRVLRPFHFPDCS